MRENELEINAYKGAQINYATDNSTIYAYQNIIIDNISSQKKLTPTPIKNSYFVGRSNEEKEIIEDLVKHHIVLINGVGGIGKTALAKKIYFDFENKYKHIAWIEFRNSWVESLVSSMFTIDYNFPEKSTENEKYEIIFRFLLNLKGNILIILNYSRLCHESGRKPHSYRI
jgi:hypothetical protein